MSHDPDAISVAKAADPVLRDSLVALFSNQNYSIISDAAGRQKLQEQALAAVRKIVQARLGRPGIDALYFTSFVMQ
jgi:flagellar FliL protein